MCCYAGNLGSILGRVETLGSVSVNHSYTINTNPICGRMECGIHMRMTADLERISKLGEFSGGFLAGKVYQNQISIHRDVFIVQVYQTK